MGNEWTSEYDILGRLVAEYDPLGHGTQYVYDATGNLVKEIDAMGNETILEYDEEGRQTYTKGPEGSEVVYSYDAVGNLYRVRQQKVATNETPLWTYEYDLLGRKVKEITPLGEEYIWEYDFMGNVIRYVTPASVQNETLYSYDLLGRLTYIGWPDGTEVNITYSFFVEEREEYEHPPIFQVEMPYAPKLDMQVQEYDLLGRLVTETWLGEGEEVSISYVYDGEGNVVEMTDQFGNVTQYSYDCRNRLRNVTDPEGQRTEFIYDAANRLIRTEYPIGTVIHREYDEAKRLVNITNMRSDSTVISSFVYQYDANGRRTSMREADGNTTYYDYDAQGRLINVSFPDGTATAYEYDRNNNIIKRTFYLYNEVIYEVNSEHDGDNRLTNMSGTEYEYDDNGNQLGVESQGTSYFLSTFMNGEKWNLRTALLENESVWASYSYSLDGRRVGKEIDIERTGEDFQRVYYLYDGQNVVYELGEMFRNFREIPNIGGIALQFQHNHPTVRYTHPLVCDGGVCGPTAYMFVDAPISIVVDGVKYYYLYDALDSVTELIDENENVVNRYRYTPFGESLYKEEGVFNPYQYTGRRYDEETGQYYYRARMYSPVQGRFLSQDPMGMIDGPNMYAYARNDPVLFRDPTGRWPPFWGPPAHFNGAQGEWCPAIFHAVTYKHTPPPPPSPPEKDDTQDYLGTYEFRWKRFFFVRIGWELSLCPTATSAVSIGLGVVALASIWVKVGIVLGAISVGLAICAHLNLGLTIDHYFIPHTTIYRCT